jgi:hypothetical protein
LAIAGSLAALIAVGGAGFLAGRGTAPAPPPAISPPPAAPVVTPKVEAPPERTLQRQDLIGLGASAADAAASGAALPGEAIELAGKRFEIFLPFGCDGPAPEGSEAPLRWRYDDKASALRIHVSPTEWKTADWWQDPPKAVEAMEGFWIERPWSSRETCPATSAVSAAPGADPVTLPGQTLGVVQLISPDAPRQMLRGGKPYETVVRMAADAAPLGQGLRVRLAGRIGRFPDGQPVRCTQSGGREQRPVCLIAVTIEEVAFQDPATDKTLSVWQPAADAPSGNRTDG